MSKKKIITINIIILSVLFLAFFFSHINKNISDNKAAKEFVELTEIIKTIDTYGKDYSLSPYDKNIVRDYVKELMATEQYEKAYGVIRKYFDETPKENYWDDLDMWQERGFASLLTHRCLEASASGWHVFIRTETGEINNIVADGILQNALNDKECINQETFMEK